ncbi:MULTISPECIES: DUF5082 family protein [unclassified Cytobacillus]|uniref:DUF5082 family protein n=1 Tax=unclassified Cytobacillus TaxID=2675268 RepID=UPI002040E91D|nr:DUF5082 family protein [Cytobacillus sp. AMY 15.2]MCM3093779.1 DUF5082 family protein [Cytobacillus sp. AMY 15.2]
MSLGYYYSLLTKKQNDLQKLLACERELQGKHQEFNHYRQTVTKPDLSPFTWQGKLADEFEDIRFEQMLKSYIDIESDQFHEVFSAISRKQHQLQQEIDSIKQTIASLEAQLAAERSKQ